MRKVVAAILLATNVLVPTVVRPANLINDGGFESPTVSGGSCSKFTVGQAIGNWIVVGDEFGIGVRLTSGTFQANGITFNSHSGGRFLNLSSEGDQSAGVEQTVSTSSGKNYVLSFWAGSVFDSTGDGVYGSYGTMSKMDVFINGVWLTSVAQPGVAGSSSQSWNQYSVKFKATSNTTTVTILGTVMASNNIGLDDVQLIQKP